MRLLFVHRYLPSQYRHLMTHFASQGHKVVALGGSHELRLHRPNIDGVELFGYEHSGSNQPLDDRMSFTVRATDAIERGRIVALGAHEFQKSVDFKPDVIFAHIGWGEAIFLKDIFPQAKLLLYCEFYYQVQGADFNFDVAEFPASLDGILRIRVHNAPFLMALDACDHGVAPTHWQQSRFPSVYRPRIKVIHDGIDTDAVTPNTERSDEQLITFVARNLEPHRGFHIFMRALPEIQRHCPRVRVAIVGGDGVSYSPRMASGESYRGRMLRELDGSIDLTRVTFLNQVPYEDYLALLHKSTVHVYLTYPFILSWSMLEAMAAGCIVVGSKTAPVEEVISEGENGFLVDFLSPESVASKVIEAIRNARNLQSMRQRARDTIVERYDLKRVCLPAHIALINELVSD